MSNAFQHSIDGGVKVDNYPAYVKEQKPIIRIMVQDGEIGMSERQLDKLFQEFEQTLDESKAPRSIDTPALGVGLAVIARYVRSLNGQIKVRSEPNKGTIFTLELPDELPKQLQYVPGPWERGGWFAC